MSLLALLVAVGATCVVVYLIQQGHLPAPFNWIVIAILIVIWVAILLNVSGFGSGLSLRVG